MRPTALLLAASAFSLALTGPAPARAETDVIASGEASASEFARFAPRPGDAAMQLDYAFWDEALGFFVLRMGPSTRDGARRPDPNLGTRRVYGHESRVRLEGNRVVYSFLDENEIAPLREYRQDLERLGSELDIATLPRNEQLAYWLNLHNVAVVEQIARNYPVQQPSRMKLGPDKTPLDTTRFINVAGVMMSPRDIRTKIVFPNWSDPDVVYGFHRGDVGGPSIQRRAFTGANVDELLDISAKEYVNSLRGVEAYGGNLLVSVIYEEAAPFYYPQLGQDFRAHLATHADEDVKALMAEKSGTKTNQYDYTVADLAAGDREPTYNTVTSDGVTQSFRITPSVARLMIERDKKFEKLRKQGELRGRVIVLPMEGQSATVPAPPPEEKDPAEDE